MSDKEILDLMRQRYTERGIEAFTYPAIKQDGLYHHLYARGLALLTIVQQLDIEEEYRAHRRKSFTRKVNGEVLRGWTWERVIKETSEVVERLGYLPPAQWFQQNRKATIVSAIYNLKRDWNDLRRHFDSYENSTFVESRNGLRWLSHPEASLSNFLYARGIQHKKGERYPESYAKYGDAAYGYYDLHFIGSGGSWIDVEVWGDKPNGHNERRYKQTRRAKERFNASNPNFLGIHYADCLNEARLEQILSAYIGVIQPYVFDEPTDRYIETAHWSNADELLDSCRALAAQQPDGLFPTEEWLRKRGKWKGRPGPAYNTISIYIKTWLGGIRALRKLLNQEHASTEQWNKERALEAYRAFHARHGLTAGQIRRSQLPEAVKKEASRITAAIEKYTGMSMAEVNEHLGIHMTPRSKWSRSKIRKRLMNNGLAQLLLI